MRTQRTDVAAHEAPRVPVQAKLAAAWTSFMFLYIYVDYLHLYKPGVVGDILRGVVWKFDISQTFAFSALASMAVPIMMILLSVTLPSRTNRATNLVVAFLYIPYSAFNLAGGEWVYYYSLGLVFELVILAFIIRSAWTWPRISTTSMAHSVAPARSDVPLRR